MARREDLCNLAFLTGAQISGASVKKTSQLSTVSKRAVTKVTSAFRSVGETSVNRAGNCGGKRTFSERDARALVRY